MSGRPHCLAPAACKAKSDKHCRDCTLVANNKSPEMREAKRKAMFRIWAQPEARAQRSESISATLRDQMNDPVLAEQRRQLGLLYGKRNLMAGQAPDVRARGAATNSERRLADIPPDVRDEYRRMVHNGHYTREEAKRILLEDRRARGRREVREVERLMVEKDRQRRSQEY